MADRNPDSGKLDLDLTVAARSLRQLHGDLSTHIRSHSGAPISVVPPQLAHAMGALDGALACLNVALLQIRSLATMSPLVREPGGLPGGEPWGQIPGRLPVRPSDVVVDWRNRGSIPGPSGRAG